MGSDKSKTGTIISLSTIKPTSREQIMLAGRMIAACELVQSVKVEIWEHKMASPELRKFAAYVTEMNNKLSRAISDETEIPNEIIL